MNHTSTDHCFRRRQRKQEISEQRFRHQCCWESELSPVRHSPSHEDRQDALPENATNKNSRYAGPSSPWHRVLVGSESQAWGDSPDGALATTPDERR
jgi:hypothetical protein